MSARKAPVASTTTTDLHQTFKAGAAAWERARQAATQNSTAVATSVEATLNGWGRLHEHALAAGTRVVQDQIAVAAEFCRVKTPAEALQLQARFARNALDSCIASWTAGAELVSSSFEEATRPLSARLKTVLDDGPHG